MDPSQGDPLKGYLSPQLEDRLDNAQWDPIPLWDFPSPSEKWEGASFPLALRGPRVGVVSSGWKSPFLMSPPRGIYTIPCHPLPAHYPDAVERKESEAERAEELL